MTAQTVLVIDDERDIRELLTITLGRMDLQVDAVGTMAEALRALAERTYDLCFTDMRLPDGIAVGRREAYRWRRGENRRLG
jgi:two-component system response regulator PilR (NtrC family)